MIDPEKISAYPLTWPDGWKRTSHGFRKSGNFSRQGRRIGIPDAVDRVVLELERMHPGISRDDIVISTNRKLRLNGRIDAASSEPGDVGVAVYWQTVHGSRVIAIDTYDRIADNLAAIGNTLDAMRAIKRHGSAEILDRVFTGFAALPAPAGRPWHHVFKVPANAETEHVREAYRFARSACHPDKGGTDAAMAEVNAAWAQFKRARGL
jgi:hypothetical protein